MAAAGRSSLDSTKPVAGVDAMIIGAGPAGLSAALWLGRCRRRTVVFDSGQPRNAASRALHGYLTRDGCPPMKLRAAGRAELRRYPTLQLHDTGVRAARRRGKFFEVETQDGRRWQARLLLLATGRIDSVPPVPGFRELYGQGVYHCPYCDGWEHRDEPIAILGHGAAARNLARLLTTWSRDLTVLTNGRRPTRALRALDVPILTTPLGQARMDRQGRMAGLELADGTTRPCRALFFCSECSQKSSLPERLGCEFDRGGSVICRAHAATNVPGLFVAGNVRGGMHLAIMAAAEGAEAACAMNEFLLGLDGPLTTDH